VRQQVRARAAGEDQGFGQGERHPPAQPAPGLIEAADKLADLFEAMLPAMCARLRQAFKAKLESEADKLDSGASAGASRAWRALDSPNRCEVTLEAWRTMLRGLHNDGRSGLRRRFRRRAELQPRSRRRHVPPLSSTRPSRS